jgi:hypothetical protein
MFEYTKFSTGYMYCLDLTQAFHVVCHKLKPRVSELAFFRLKKASSRVVFKIHFRICMCAKSKHVSYSLYV